MISVMLYDGHRVSVRGELKRGRKRGNEHWKNENGKRWKRPQKQNLFSSKVISKLKSLYSVWPSLMLFETVQKRRSEYFLFIRLTPPFYRIQEGSGKSLTTKDSFCRILLTSYPVFRVSHKYAVGFQIIQLGTYVNQKSKSEWLGPRE